MVYIFVAAYELVIANLVIEDVDAFAIYSYVSLVVVEVVTDMAADVDDPIRSER